MRGYFELATGTELTSILAQKFNEKPGFEQADKVVEYRIKTNNRQNPGPPKHCSTSESGLLQR